MRTKYLLSALILIAGVQLFAQTTDYTKEPGYFDYEKALKIKLGSAVTEVYLEEPMLKMIARMTKDEKEGVSAALEALKVVRVNEYITEKKDSAQIETDVELMSKQLQSLKWTRIIKTKSHGSFANVFVKEGTSGEYLGLLLLAMDKNGKLTFVNIVGKIDLESFGKISGQLGIPNAGGKK